MWFHRPMKQTRGRSLDWRNAKLAPPLRREYHWNPCGRPKSAIKLFNRCLMTPGEEDRSKSPGAKFATKFLRAPISHMSSMTKDSWAPVLCPPLVKGRDQTSRVHEEFHVKSAFLAQKSSPVRAYRSNPRRRRSATSGHPFWNANCARA